MVHGGEFHPAPRVDLESVSDVITYLLMGGNLPWHGHQGHDEIAAAKRDFMVQKAVLPAEVSAYFSYCCEMHSQFMPDYDYMRCMFMQLLWNEGPHSYWGLRLAGCHLRGSRH